MIAKRALSIIVPTLNEEGNIEILSQRIYDALSKNNIDFEIIFIDDHSKDKTIEKIVNLSSKYNAVFHIKKGQPGKAFSLIEGFKYAKYEILCMIDADLQYSPEYIPEMFDIVYKNESDIVISNRKYIDVSFSRRLPSFVFKFLFAGLLHGLHYDVQSGLKIFKKEITDKITLHPTPWTFDMEFLINAKKLGYRVSQVNIDFLHRYSGEEKVKVFRSSYEIGISAIQLKLREILKIITF